MIERDITLILGVFGALAIFGASATRYPRRMYSVGICSVALAVIIYILPASDTQMKELHKIATVSLESPFKQEAVSLLKDGDVSRMDASRLLENYKRFKMELFKQSLSTNGSLKPHT